MNFKNSILLLVLVFSSCYKESKLLVNAGFSVEVVENSYTTPVKINVENTTTGADFYLWTFEGGEPATSTEKNPGIITYRKAGTYIIILEAWNDNERDKKEYTFTADSAVNIGFNAEFIVNNYAPASVQITNTTTGANEFLWTFQGGTPSTSTEQHPGEVLFQNPGDHLITLQANNGRETFTLSKTITLKDTLDVDFDIEPFVDNFDYEAPFGAQLINKTKNALTYEWTCEGAVLGNPGEENTQLTIQQPGTYSIMLTATNGQQTKNISKEITIKANSNLYTIKDVKFGIKAASNTIGYSYDIAQRKIVKTNDITSENGANIAIVFSGINAGFEQNFFLSPDYASENTGFFPIPNAVKTYFVNKLENTNLHFTSADFDTMVTDALLKTLNIKENGETTGTNWFSNSQIPRFVLFETEQGLKGVIKIKAFVSEGNNSYILTDIKQQKLAD